MCGTTPFLLFYYFFYITDSSDKDVKFDEIILAELAALIIKFHFYLLLIDKKDIPTYKVLEIPCVT